MTSLKLNKGEDEDWFFLSQAMKRHFITPLSYSRQLDRISDENESLLQQMDTYCTQLKAVAREKGELEGNFKSIKEELSKSERQFRKRSN